MSHSHLRTSVAHSTSAHLLLATFVLLSLAAVLCADENVLPFQVKEPGSAVIVRARIKDRDIALLVDTGTRQSHLDESLEDELEGFAGYRRTQPSDDIGSVTLWRAPVIRIGSSAMKSDSQIASLKLRSRLNDLTGLPLDGVLGMDYLKKWVVTLDFDRYEMGLSPSLETSLGLGEKIPLRFENDLPFIFCTIESHRHAFMVDTGGLVFATVTPDTFKQFSSGANELKAFNSAVGCYCREFSFGHSVHKAPFIGVLRSAPFNILGLYCLNRHRIVFDFERQAMFVAPARSFDAPRHDFNDGVHIMHVMHNGKGGHSIEVLQGGDAAIAGLKSEDMLLALDKEDVRDVDVATIRRKWSHRGKRELKVLVRRNAFDEDDANDLEVEAILPAESKRVK